MTLTAPRISTPPKRCSVESMKVNGSFPSALNRLTYSASCSLLANLARSVFSRPASAPQSNLMYRVASDIRSVLDSKTEKSATS